MTSTSSPHMPARIERSCLARSTGLRMGVGGGAGVSGAGVVLAGGVVGRGGGFFFGGAAPAFDEEGGGDAGALERRLDERLLM